MGSLAWPSVRATLGPPHHTRTSITLALGGQNLVARIDSDSFTHGTRLVGCLIPACARICCRRCREVVQPPLPPAPRSAVCPLLALQGVPPAVAARVGRGRRPPMSLFRPSRLPPTPPRRGLEWRTLVTEERFGSHRTSICLSCLGGEARRRGRTGSYLTIPVRGSLLGSTTLAP